MDIYVKFAQSILYVQPQMTGVPQRQSFLSTSVGMIVAVYTSDMAFSLRNDFVPSRTMALQKMCAIIDFYQLFIPP